MMNHPLFYFPSWSDGWRKFWRSSEWRPWSIHAASPVILPQDHNTQETLFDPIIKGTTNVMNSGANVQITLKGLVLHLLAHWPNAVSVPSKPLPSTSCIGAALDHCKRFNMRNIYICNLLEDLFKYCCCEALANDLSGSFQLCMNVFYSLITPSHFFIFEKIKTKRNTLRFGPKSYICSSPKSNTFFSMKLCYLTN